MIDAGEHQFSYEELHWAVPLFAAVSDCHRSLLARLPRLPPESVELRFGHGVVDLIQERGCERLRRITAIDGLQVRWRDGPGARRWAIEIRVRAPDCHVDGYVDAMELFIDPSDRGIRSSGGDGSNLRHH